MNTDVKQIINTLWRWKVVLISILIVTIVGLGIVYVTADESYTSFVELQITTPQNEDIALFGSIRYASEREAVTVARNNFSVVVESDIIRDQTIQELGLSEKEGEYVLEIEPVYDADFMTIGITSSSPELAAAIANTHIQKSITRLGLLRSLPAQQKLEDFGKELADAEISLREAESALSTFQEENELSSSLQNEIETYEQRLQRLVLNRSDLLISEPFSGSSEVELINTLIVERENELQPLLAIRHQYNNLLAELSTAQNLLEIHINNNPGLLLTQEPLASAQQRVTRAENELNSFLIQNDINAIEGDIRQLSTLIEELKLERDRRLIAPSENLQNARVLTIDSLIVETEERVNYLAALEPEYNFLSIQLSRATADYDFILQKYNEAEIVTASTASADFIQIITLATPPEEPSSNILFLLIFGFVGSLGFGIFLAFVLEYVTTAVQTEPQLPTEEPEAEPTVENEGVEGYHFPVRLQEQPSQGD